ALSPRDRRILELRFLEGCTVQQAADELGVTTGNAKVLQHRALRRAGEIAQSAG
ncbi:MAG: RNA polymerase subunit sigma, partial [Pseudonocardiales bacterium]